MNHIKKWAAKFPDGFSQEAFLNGVASLYRNQVFAPVALAIKAGGSALIKSTTITYAMVGGILVKLAAGDMPALTGISIPDGSKQMIGFAIDVSGALTLVAGRQGTTIGNVGMPTKPEGTVMLGLALIENGTGSTFTGGTTPIDTASLTVTYFNLTTAIEPLSTI